MADQLAATRNVGMLSASGPGVARGQSGEGNPCPIRRMARAVGDAKRASVHAWDENKGTMTSCPRRSGGCREAGRAACPSGNLPSQGCAWTGAFDAKRIRNAEG